MIQSYIPAGSECYLCGDDGYIPQPNRDGKKSQGLVWQGKESVTQHLRQEINLSVAVSHQSFVL